MKQNKEQTPLESGQVAATAKTEEATSSSKKVRISAVDPQQDLPFQIADDYSRNMKEYGKCV